MDEKNIDDMLRDELTEKKESTEPENDPVESATESESAEIPEGDEGNEHPETTVETLDDYGNKIETKERMFTQSEVENMIRERLSRGQHAQPQPVEDPLLRPINQYEQPGYQQKEPYESDLEWQQQLESFIDQTIQKREQETQKKTMQAKMLQEQSEFEQRFISGAAKYSDFDQVLSGKPITTEMVVATKGMKNPASFLYAAAKTQADELARISKIRDPYSLALEVGRLEERMRKSAAVTKAPPPVSKTAGDSYNSKERARSIDDRIIEYARQSKR